MNLLDTIREKIQTLYETHPDVHVTVNLRSPRRVRLSNVPAVIKGVYPHMFQVEYKGEGTTRLFLHQYTDIVTKEIEILELTNISDSPTLKTDHKGNATASA